VRPSETTCGQEWLANFHGTDVPTAELLIDCLRFLSLSALRTKLQQLLDGAVDSGSIPLPALVIPERSLKHLGIAATGRDAAVAWRDFLPGAPLSVTPGSDGFVGMVLRDYARAGVAPASRAGRWISPDADIGSLRLARCRSIVLLTDYVGSGAQAETLAAAIARHPTIRSWRSLHLVEIHVAAVSAQRIGIERLEESRSVDAVHEIEAAPSIWTRIKNPDAQRAVVDLCRTYGRQRKLALGYGESGGLMVTERGAPNNLPAIFIQQAAGWRPLFPDRTVPQSFVDELGTYRPSESLAVLAQRIGQIRLGRNERLDSMRRASRDLLRVLTLASDGPTDAHAIAESMGMDVAEAAAHLVTLQNWGFADTAGRITAAGRSELVEHKRGRRWTTAHLQGSSDPYYPVGLR
jgi:hypothetical protein